MTVTYKVDTQSFDRALREYAMVSGKSYEMALAKQGRNIAWELWRGFKTTSPARGEIASAASARHFRIGRRANEFTKAIGGVSAAAWARAYGLMSEEYAKSAYFKVDYIDGVPRVRRVRFAMKRPKVLRGGRHGSRFSKSARTLTQLTLEERAKAGLKSQGLKLLNIQAVRVASEIGYRSRAAQGGFLAWQWLPREYRRRGIIKKGPIRTTNRRGKKMGEVRFATDAKGHLNAITLHGMLPGTAEVESRHRIVDSALPAAKAQLEHDILREIEKAVMIL